MLKSLGLVTLVSAAIGTGLLFGQSAFSGDHETTVTSTRSFSPPRKLSLPTQPVLIGEPRLVRAAAVDRETGATVVTVDRGGAPIFRPSVSTDGDAKVDHYQRARQLQRELSRVGCYAGAVDGDWGGASKRAMQTFLDRVNAMLPVDEPAAVLIALVGNHAGAVCRDTCSATDAIGRDGRCIATGLIAASTGATTRGTSSAGEAVAVPDVPGSGWNADVVADSMRDVSPEPLPGRMALGVATDVPETPEAPPVALTRTESPAAAPRPRRPKPSMSWARDVFPDLYVGR